MEQSELRHWEQRCVQEETPQCTAACPIHVDARAFCALVGQRRWDKAWTVLARTMPLPGVLARICDAPCREACIRKDVGGAIELGGLERFCAENAKPASPPAPLPSRGKSVAVIGGGMTGLCAAWEMARRGFAVSLHCATAGAALLELAEDILPAETVRQELANLEKLGVDMHTGVTVDPALLESLCNEADAVFIDGDDAGAELANLGEPDDITLGTLRPGAFASQRGQTSPALQAAAGRRAANSIERFTQGVSMVSGRELEGPYPTRLFTSLEGVDSLPSALPDHDPDETQARDEARRCLQCECMECVKVCEYLKHYKYYPKVYARQIYNNASIVMGTRQANSMINSCMLCGLCETVCPEDFSMAELCLQARRGMVRRGKMPPSAHEFALRDMAFANGGHCALARHAPGQDESEYLFFPGCQLTASAPGTVERAYADLLARLGSVGLMLHCCGAPALWAGREELEQESMALLRSEWKRLGSPRIIAACPSCMTTLRQGLPDAEIVSHWSVLRTLGLPQTASAPAAALAVNDPCAARHDGPQREDVRALLDQLGVDIVEPALSGELTQCCGYGGLANEANPKIGELAARRRAEAVDEDYVTYCAMCRDMIAGTGKRASHLYDLLFPGTDDIDQAHYEAYYETRTARPSPGYSARRENRVHLREGLLRTLWREAADVEAAPHEAIVIRLTETAEAAMQKRRILTTDVQKVLLQARQTGHWLASVETGHLVASLRPAAVTYWVEFEPVAEESGGEGYVVHNAWSHRMRIKGGQP